MFLGGCCFKPDTSKDGLKLFEIETVLSLEIRKPRTKADPSTITKVSIMVVIWLIVIVIKFGFTFFINLAWVHSILCSTFHWKVQWIGVRTVCDLCPVSLWALVCGCKEHCASISPLPQNSGRTTLFYLFSLLRFLAPLLLLSINKYIEMKN